MNKRGFIECMGIELDHGPLWPFEKNNIKLLGKFHSNLGRGFESQNFLGFF